MTRASMDALLSAVDMDFSERDFSVQDGDTAPQSSSSYVRHSSINLETQTNNTT